ncbi:MAG TPA: ABC transporter permease [Acholeplasma sp.]|jgi:ABC-2 type transport system permease protein|nr:ABC transporter permease [Acholeplasma sp.]
MRVFKLFLRLSKENKAGIIMTLLLTALMIVLFYALPREQQAGYAAQKIRVSYHIENESPLTDNLKEYLSNYVYESKLSLDEIEDAHYFQIVTLSIIIEGNLSEDLKNDNAKIELYSKNAEEFINAAVITELYNYLNLYQAFIENGIIESEAIELTNETLTNSHVETHLVQQTQDFKVIAFRAMNYLSYIVILIGLTIVVPIMIKMKEEKVLKRTLVSPYKRKKYYLELYLGAILYTIIASFIIFLLVTVLFRDMLTVKEILLYALNMLMYTLPIIAISVFTGVLSKKETISSIVSNVFGLGQSFLVGVFIGREYLDPSMKVIGRLLPGNYLVNANEFIRDGTYTVNNLMGEYLMLILFAAIFVGLLIVINIYKKHKRVV